MIHLNEKQIQMIRHAVGFDGRSKVTYRNHYCIGRGCDGFGDWMDLVTRGLAYRRAGSEISGGDDVFWASREAVLAVRKQDEHLARDFSDGRTMAAL